MKDKRETRRVSLKGVAASWPPPQQRRRPTPAPPFIRSWIHHTTPLSAQPRACSIPPDPSRPSSTMDAPPAVIEPSTSSSSTASVHSTASKVWGVCLVAFDHAVGPTIEYSYPPELSLNEELNKNLPFLALPDGAHTVS